MTVNTVAAGALLGKVSWAKLNEKHFKKDEFPDLTSALELAKLIEEERQLAAKLGIGQKLPTHWVGLIEVRSRLPADSVLILIVRMPIARFTPVEPVSPHQYVAWIVPATGPVEVCDLGTAAVIDSEVQKVRSAIQELKDEPLKQSSRVFLDRLLQAKEVRTARRWLISPDGLLWQVPWEALVLPDNRYALQQYRISYLVTGRELLRPESTQVQRKAPVLITNPAFGQVRRNQQLMGSVLLSGGLALPGGQPLGSLCALITPGLYMPAAEPLFDMTEDAAAVKTRIQQCTGQVPISYSDSNATEQAVRNIRHPHLICYGTHGFIIDGRASGNLFQNCGIALAGYNLQFPAPNGIGDNGFLTGAEILQGDLRDTDLVVVAACNSSLGHAAPGLGIAGFRQSFHLNGVPSVIATLWSVEGHSSWRLVDDYFRHLARGDSKADALREAQLGLLRSRDWSEPYFWAGFTFSGDPGDLAARPRPGQGVLPEGTFYPPEYTLARLTAVFLLLMVGVLLLKQQRKKRPFQ